MYRHILIPLGNDPCSQIAARHAFDLSRLLGPRVTLLHIQNETLLHVQNETLLHVQNESDELSQEGFWLTELAKQARFEPQIRLVSSSDSVAKLILEVAKTEKADLIVMGTHGREGIERLQLGSGAQAVAGSSSIPVQIVPVRVQAAHGFM